MDVVHLTKKIRKLLSKKTQFLKFGPCNPTRDHPIALL